jgi:hypothetical protein
LLREKWHTLRFPQSLQQGMDMDELFFAGYGIEILRRENRLFVRYDAGHIAVQMQEDEITQTEAEKACLSERDAYDLLLAIERRRCAKSESSLP